MRILQVSNYMGPPMGGIERVAATLVAGLRRRGHDLRWVASTSTRPGPSDGPLRPVASWSFLYNLLGLPIAIWKPGAVRTLLREIRWADAVHLHDCLYMPSLITALACREMGKPLLLTQHIAFVPFSPVLNMVEKVAYATLGRFVLGMADRVIAYSPHVPPWFHARGIRPRFSMIPNGIDASVFHPVIASERLALRERWKIAPEARVVLFVGRLVAKKGIPGVVHARRALPADQVTFVLVGDGPLSDQVRSLPSTLHLRSLPREEMAQMYALADVFLLPSRGEGFPLAVQEAMMSGLGVVLTDDPSYQTNLGGAPGVVQCRDDAEIVEALQRLLQDPPPRDAIAAWASARWGLDRFLAHYEEALERLCRPRARAASADAAIFPRL